MPKRRKGSTWFIILLLVGIFVAFFLFLQHCVRQLPEEKEPVVNGCDYFNGEILEISEEYLVLKPIKDWTWQTVSKVKIPLKTVKEEQISEVKIADVIRVAFNGNSMEWTDDEVVIRIVFAVFPESESKEQDE